MKIFLACVCAMVLAAGCGTSAAPSQSSDSVAASMGAKTLSAAANLIAKKDAGGISAAVNSASSAENPFGQTDVSPSDFYEFGTFYSDGIPEDANFPALKYAEGGWKYYLDIEDPETGGVTWNEFGLADLSLDYDKEQVIIVLHPKYAGDGYELYPETDEGVGYEPFTGGFDENGALKLSGNHVVLYITNYFAWSGREYVMAESWYSEESYGIFLLTRGQQ